MTSRVTAGGAGDARDALVPNMYAPTAAIRPPPRPRDNIKALRRGVCRRVSVALNTVGLSASSFSSSNWSEEIRRSRFTE